jgi:PAP2 superfamily
VSLALAAATRRRWVKLLALLWAPLVTLAVIATGNHYVFDVVTGALTAAVGYVLGRSVTSLVNAPRRSPARPPQQVRQGQPDPMRPPHQVRPVQRGPIPERSTA